MTKERQGLGFEMEDGEIRVVVVLVVPEFYGADCSSSFLLLLIYYQNSIDVSAAFAMPRIGTLQQVTL